MNRQENKIKAKDRQPADAQTGVHRKSEGAQAKET
jgi:hypothetical protein